MQHLLFDKMMWIYLSSILMFVMCNSQDIIFPKDEEFSHISGNNLTLTERIPVYIPNKCPDNMLLYPGGGNKSVWICDCRPRFLYFPLNHTCHEAYRQGPCSKGEYVVLPPDEVVPKCSVNPCGEDGLVRYNDTCYYLQTKGGPCAPDGVIGVNETTYEIQCISTELAPFVIINVPQLACPPGSRRNSLGVCKPPI